MICSTSFFNKSVRLLLIFLALSLWGCAAQTTAPILDSSAGGNAEQQNAGAEPQETSTPFPEKMLIAFLPPENLSGTRAPLKRISKVFMAALNEKGFHVLDSELLEEFRKKYRMRYTGGVSSYLSEALQKEMNVDAIMITSLEAYNEQNPPQISLISRLVSSGLEPEILWIDSIGLSGDQAPGLLDLTLVRESEELLAKAVEDLASSVAYSFIREEPNEDTFLPHIPEGWRAKGPGTLTSPGYRLNRKYLPYDYFRSSVVERAGEYSVAVIPMNDLAVRKYAGKIASLHYVKELFNLTNYKVFEPGLVREQLLRFRAIMPSGPSLAIADLITSESSLGADLVLSGKMFDYQNSSANPKVDYSVHVIEKKSRKVVFGARTFSAGQDGVFFFNVGRVFTAHNLLEEMCKVTVQLLNEPYLPWEPAEGIIADTQPKSENRDIPSRDRVAGTGGLAENDLLLLYWE